MVLFRLWLASWFGSLRVLACLMCSLRRHQRRPTWRRQTPSPGTTPGNPSLENYVNWQASPTATSAHSLGGRSPWAMSLNAWCGTEGNIPLRRGGLKLVQCPGGLERQRIRGLGPPKDLSWPGLARFFSGIIPP